MLKKQKSFLRLSGIFLILLIIASLGLHCSEIFMPSDKIPAAAKDDFGLMAEAWNTINAHYVDRPAIKSNTMTYGAISGMVDSLGDTGHSAFLSPDMLKEERKYTKGRYKGVGIEVRMKDKKVVIVAPLDGSPAQKAGLLPGEVIVAVDGKETAGLSLSRVVGMISGPEGTRTTLKILDPDTGGKRDVTLIRTDIIVKNVTWHRLPGTEVAHLRISAFSKGVTKNLKSALKKIKEENLKGIILDLRNNSGGLLDEAVSSASQFLSGGNVLQVRNAGGKVSPVPVKKGGMAPGIPLTVLINAGTASASEIMAGALLDNHRATLVGTTTFGTGTVLQTFPLSDGSAIMLAVEEWLTPHGNTIWHKGITPDAAVDLPHGTNPLFPDAERDLTARGLMESRDSQLLHALDLLNKE